MAYRDYVSTIYGVSGRPLSSLDQSIDLKKLLTKLANNRSAGYVYSRHSSEFHDNPSSEIVQLLKGLKKKFRENQYRNTLMLSEARHIFTQLTAADVKWVALKGASLIPTVYRDIGSRKMGDIDILIAPEHKGTALKIFREFGFKWEDSTNSSTPPIELSKKVASNNINIDLTWRPLHRSLSVDSEGLREVMFTESQLIADDFCGNVSVPKVEAQIVYICGNHVLHNDYSYITGIIDLHEIIKHSIVDWNRVMQNASTVNLEKAVLLSLLAAKLTLGTDIPQHLITDAEKVSRKIGQSPAQVYFEVARVIEDYEETSVRQRGGGLKKNLARFYWRAIVDVPTREKGYCRQYLENKCQESAQMKLLMIKVVAVMLTVLMNSLRPLLRYWLVGSGRHKDYIV